MERNSKSIHGGMTESHSLYKFVVGPDSVNHLTLLPQASLSIAFTILPKAFKDLPISSSIFSFPVLKALLKKARISSLIRPTIHSKAIELAILPLSLVALAICHFKLADTFETASRKSASVLILPKFAVGSLAFFDSLPEFAFIFGCPSPNLLS